MAMGRGIFFLLILVCLGGFDFAAADVRCRDLLTRQNLVSLQTQVAQVRHYEQKARLKYKDSVHSDLEVVSQILSIYRQVAGESARTMSDYMKKRRPVDAAINAYLQARYESLSEKEAELVTKVLRSTTFNPSKILGNADEDKDITAGYIPSLKRIHFEMPERYKDTLLYWFMFAHEMEHAIQDARLNLSFVNHDIQVSGYAMNEIRYLAELGAMTAEWVFLQGIKPELIAQQRAEVEKARDIEEGYRAYFLRALGNANLPLHEYIRREHEAGRYSREALVYEPDLE